MKVYISGRFSGLPYEEVKENFKRAEEYLRAQGYETVSPLDLSPDPSLSWEEHMKKDLSGMLQCDAICMIEGWEKSRGATLEYYIAVQIGMKKMEL